MFRRVEARFLTIVAVIGLSLAGCASRPAGTIGEIARDGRGLPVWSAIPHPAAPEPAPMPPGV